MAYCLRYQAQTYAYCSCSPAATRRSRAEAASSSRRHKMSEALRLAASPAPSDRPDRHRRPPAVAADRVLPPDARDPASDLALHLWGSWPRSQSCSRGSPRSSPAVFRSGSTRSSRATCVTRRAYPPTPAPREPVAAVLERGRVSGRRAHRPRGTAEPADRLLPAGAGDPGLPARLRVPAVNQIVAFLGWFYSLSPGGCTRACGT